MPPDDDCLKQHITRANFLAYIQRHPELRDRPSPVGYGWTLVNGRCRPVHHTQQALPPEVIRPLRDDALFWHRLWKEANKPPTGVVACIMRATRAKYHRAIKTNRDQQTKLRRNKLAQYCAENKYRQLWSEISKIDKNNQCTPQSVDGHSESVEIVEVFARRYKDL